MSKRITVSIFAVIFFIIIGASYFLIDSHYQLTKVIKPNLVSQNKAKLTVVTFGERLQSKQIYFVQWESLNQQKQKKALSEYNVFIFSKDAFVQKSHETLIQTLIKNHKTVLFYGYHLNVKDILSSGTSNIPYYDIQSSKPVYYYLYGYGKVPQNKDMTPIVIMGNFSNSKANEYITQYLIEAFKQKKAE